MNTLELMPCPFCGGEPRIERKGTARASMIIICDDCGCKVESGDVLGLTKPESLKWNLRFNPMLDIICADSKNVRAQRDELREALRALLSDVDDGLSFDITKANARAVLSKGKASA